MPTTVENDIGTGGDFATIVLWEAAIDNDLVTADELQIGNLLNETHANGSITVTFAAGIYDATRHPVLRASPGSYYDPISDTGPKVTTTTPSTMFNLQDPHIYLEGFYAEATGTGNLNCIVNGAGAADCRVHRIVVKRTAGDGGNGVSRSSDSGMRVTSCIFIGSNSAGSGMDNGFTWSTAQASIYNCVAYGVRGTGAIAINHTHSNAASIVRNCLAIECGTCFGFGASTTRDHNGSSDSTADGTGSLTSLTSAIFNNAAANDFRLVSGSSPDGAGSDESGIFTEDFAGATHGAGGTAWNMGAYEEVVSAATERVPEPIRVIKPRMEKRARYWKWS